MARRQIAADLVGRACLRERIGKGRRQPLILHADNGNPYCESLFRTVNYRPDYPRRPFSSKDEACLWVAGFVDWYNHQHRHSGIRFVTPAQRHSGEAVEICRQRAHVYEQAPQRYPRRWSRGTRCWRQPGVVWINPPPPENALDPATLAMAA
jgi:hypothetical protein